jgi:RNA polymerase sigma-70 factor (sigma-E family)
VVASRDHGDFVEFAAAYGDQMRRTAYLLCGDWHRASDITQEALIRLYVAWPRLDDDGGLRSYARKAVTSAAFDISRKRSSQELVAADLGERVGADATEAVAESLVMLDALAQLPPRQRACVVLRYYEDLSVEEVASVLGCRPGTVKSQTSAGLAALRTALGDALDDLRPAG